MKKLCCVIFFVLGISLGHAQEIDSIVFVPAAPTSTDTIRAYVYLTFPSGSCADVGTYTVNGTDIYGYAFHCMGMISTICNDVDTLIIPPLAAGNYTMYFTLDAGYGPPGNCTAGFQPYDVDTVPLVVTLSTAIAEQSAGEIHVYPNPATDQLIVESQGGDCAVIQFVNVLGVVVLEQPIREGSNRISLEEIPDGLYQTREISAKGVRNLQNILIIK